MTPVRSEDGWIEVVTGCMFSGKTEELLRRIERAEIAGQDVEVFKPSVDDRYSEENIDSHNGRARKAEVVDAENISDITDKVENYDVVAFDEANFFTEELVEISERLAENGFRVIIAGLDTDFRGEPFSPVHKLMAQAEYVDKLRAICVECGDPAIRTQRIIDGEPASKDDPTIVVGADEKYEARCRSCHKVKR